MFAASSRGRNAKGRKGDLPPRPKSCARYKQVDPVVDTGLNTRKRSEESDKLRHFFRVQPDEVFRRVNVDTLVTLIVDVQHLLRDSEQAEDGFHLPYLLLDVRAEEDFRRGHIATARHYPLQKLARTLQFDTDEMRLYKRRPDTIVVVYDDSELAASRCAQALTQRGYDNIFLLSGGLKLAHAAFPDCLVQKSGLAGSGSFPELLADGQLQQLEQALQRYQMGGVPTGTTGAGTVCSQQPSSVSLMSSATRATTRSNASSTGRSNMSRRSRSVAPQPPFK